MEIRHLRYFLAVAEELHFGRAARRLRIAQPPLSRQIRDLEDEMAVQLFRRDRRGVALTPAGTSFLGDVRGILGSLDRAVDQAQRADRGEVGSIMVGYVSSVAYSGLPEVLRAFRLRYPEVSIGLHEMPPAAQVKALRDGEIDVGFVRAPMEESSLDSEVVRREPLVAALPAAHPLAASKRIDLASLAGEPFILFPRWRGPGFFDYIVGLCRAAGFSPRIAYEAAQLDILSLVAGGMGVSIVPSSIRAVRRAGIAFRPIVGNPSADLLVAWRAPEPSPVVREFVAIVQKMGMGQSKLRSPKT